MGEYTQKSSQGRSVGIVEKKVHTFAEPPKEMVLACGRRLGPVTLAYETYGKLNAEKSNAVLILHALSGDAHVAGFYSAKDEKPGWWDSMVGPGKGIDTNTYFVICSNIIGSCMGSTGPCTLNPQTVTPYGLDFPVVTIGDMVRAQKTLIDFLGIKKLLAAVGGSVGGMQVLEWCIRYPEMVTAAIPLATTTRHSALAIAFNEVARQAIMADPNWNHGDYYYGDRPETGLAVARMIASWIEQGATVLDLGCGEGSLLEYLIQHQHVKGSGIEQNESRVAKCIQKSLSVLQGDINSELEDYPDNSFDYVILSQTLQQVYAPDKLIRSMLRIGRKGIVSFPNFSHWRVRLQLLTSGFAPVTKQLPYQWYNTPNIRVITLRDFRKFAREVGYAIIEEVAINSQSIDRAGSIVRWMPDLRATYGMFLIRDGSNPS
jgi:methionine biosynthesis protein MetW